MARSTRYYDPSVVICKEIINGKWNGGLNPPQFDIASAMSHPGLINKLSSNVECVMCNQVRNEIKTKMDELDRKLKCFKADSLCWTSWIAILSVASASIPIPLLVSQYLMDEKIDWKDISTKYGMITLSSVLIELIVILALNYLYFAKRSKSIKRNQIFSKIVDDHFIDWKEKGIKTELRYKDEKDDEGDWEESNLRSLKISLIASNEEYWQEYWYVGH